MAVLYQKYRPQRFADIVGQSHIVRTLQNATASENLAHAYLLTGSRGVGKTTIARLLAKAANCTNLKKGEVCGSCEVCQAIEQGNFLDLVEIDAASNTGVDNIRELIEHVQFRPSLGKRKVFIIDEVHMLSKQAFNALLKTLEEPPEHAMFVLATTDIQKVPDTIISRVQRFEFPRIEHTDMQNHLQSVATKEKIDITPEVISLVVDNAEGGLRDALSLLEKLKAYSSSVDLKDAQKLLGVTGSKTIFELFELIFNKQSELLPDYFEKQSAEGADFYVLNKEILLWLKQMLFVKLTGKLPSSKENQLADELSSAQTVLEGLVKLTEPTKIIFITRLFLRSFQEQVYAPSADLPLLLASVEAVQSLGATLSTTQAKTSVVVDSSIKTSINKNNEPTLKENNSSLKFINDFKQSNLKSVTLEELLISEDSENSSDAVIIDLNVDQVKLWWPEVVTTIKQTNSPLATLLRNCPIQEVENNRIILGVKYLFHKENIENKKNTALIQEVIKTISGHPLGIKTVIAKTDNNMQLSETIDAISDAVKIFGGELVE